MDSTRLIWGGGLTAHLILLAVLVRKGRTLLFPSFTALIVFYILRSVALFSLYEHMAREHYLYTFWGLALTDLFLQVVVLSGLLRGVVKRGKYPAMRTSLLGVGGIFAAGIITLYWGPWPSLLTPGSDDINPLMLLSILAGKGNILLGLLTLETMLVLVLTASRTGWGWRSYAQKIGHGLAFYALANLIVQAFIEKLSLPAGQTSVEQIQANLHSIHVLGYLRTASYFVSVLYWIVTLGMEEPSEPEQQRIEEITSPQPSLN
jgi:hypothetical protein